jgi:hypothetical protein
MAARPRPPVWLNLEYLSAETWVAGCHGLPSPHPRLPLVKHFYFPGFDCRHRRPAARTHDYDAWRASLRRSRLPRRIRPAAEGHRTNHDLPVQLRQSRTARPGIQGMDRSSRRPIRVLRPGCGEVSRTEGNLSLHSLPFLPQRALRRTALGLRPQFRARRGFLRPRPVGGAKPFRLADLPANAGCHTGSEKTGGLPRPPPGRHGIAAVLAGMERRRRQLDWPRNLRPALPGACRPDAPMVRKPSPSRRDLAAGLVQFCLQRLK